MDALPGFWPLAGAGAAILLAATLRGLTGFGFAIAAVPLLSLLMPPLQAVPLAIALQGIAGTIDLPQAWPDCDRRSVIPLLIGAALGTPLGLLALAVVPDAVARLGIAALATAALAVIASGLRLPLDPRPGATAGIGLLAGLCNGLAAMPGVPVIAFYLALPVSRQVARASMMVFFVAVALIGLVSALAAGLIDRFIVGATAVALPLMIAGTRLGRWLFHRGSERIQRMAAYVCLAGSALAAGRQGRGGAVVTDAPKLLLVVAVALIDPDGRVLIAQRPEGKQLAGLWEFPGGKIEPGERPEQALIRELGEELGIAVKEACLAPLTFASHAYAEVHLLMPLYACRRWEGFVQSREGQALAWVRPRDLASYPMPPADAPLIPALIDLLTF